MKAFLLAAASSALLLLADPARAQFPMDGTPGGPQRLRQSEEMAEKIETIKANMQEGLMERALHRMASTEKKELNEALVERGSLTLADGSVIESNKDAGEQIIDPRTPKGFGNPFFRAIHVEQNIKVNALMTEFEQKALSKMKWEDGDDVKANATEEIEVGTGWTPIIAEGEMKTPLVRAPEFMALFEVSPHRIIRRVCMSCDDDFKDIYYKRLTDTYNKHLRTMLHGDKFDHTEYKGTTNECWTDFTLHSTYEDAIAGTNAWTHCHPGPGFSTGGSVGFPSYSGPTGHNSANINQGTSKQKDYAFYVETPNWLPTAGAWRLDIKGSRDGADIEAVEISKISRYLDASPHRIARRVCNDCTGVFKDVYLRHNAPPTVSVLGMEKFLLESFEPIGKDGFHFQQDFDIYSTYDDAVAQVNAWEHCEWLPPDTYGFPGLCRPYKDVPAPTNQWNRVTVQGGSRTAGVWDTCLYVEAAELPPDAAVWMSEDEEMELFFYGPAEELPACEDVGAAGHNTLGIAGMTALSTTAIETKYHSSQWYANPYSTYDGSRQFCKERGMDLCPADVMCPNRAASGTAGDGYELLSGNQYNRCPEGTEVSQSECLAAGNSVTEGWSVINRDTLNVGDWGYTPCGCFMWHSAGGPILIDYDTNCGNAVFSPYAEPVCKAQNQGSEPDGGVRSGDQWAPVLDEHNLWYQIGTWYNGDASTSCRDHDDVSGAGKPAWGLYGENAFPGISQYTSLVQCCAEAEEYAFDAYAGWYDAKRCGVCRDLCFWMSVDGAVFDPKYAAGKDPWHNPIAYDASGNVKGYFTCVLSGTGSGQQSTGLDFLKDERGVHSFPHRKCGGQAFPSPAYRAEEYKGCYRTGGVSALPELVGNGQRLSHSKCADACGARNYHYFGRTGDERCYCGGRTEDDDTYARYGLVPYGAADYCDCDASDIGSNMCTYKLVDQWDPTSARKQHACVNLPSIDMRKMCYIACRDEDKGMANKLMCKMMTVMGKQYLAKIINKNNDEGGQQLHMLGGDSAEASAIGTF